MTIVDKWGRKVLIRSPRSEIFEAVERFKNSLSERNYIIAKLYYSCGFTDMEIAAVAGTTHQNISKIRRNTVKKILDALQEEAAHGRAGSGEGGRR